jgi:protein-L-isoaspartate(D-aspartate) O-methyltransferase
MEQLIQQLIDQGYLKTPTIINAFKKIKREDFLPEQLKSEAGLNAPLPIGQGQTISQPLTVAFMLELLKPKEGQKILDIGSGSGWTSAMLAEIVGPTGQVFAIERIPQLYEFGQKNAAKYKFDNLEFICADGTKGLPKQAPFDRIQVAAAAAEIPADLKKQLKVGGRLVIPTQGQDIRLIERVSEDGFEETRFPGFVFVPLIKD